MKKRQSKIFIIIGVVIATLFAVVIIYDFYEESQKKEFRVPITLPNVQEITLEDYITAKEMYQIIDVREKEEFDQGHFTDAIHIPLGELLGSQERTEEVRVLRDEKKITFFCHDGLRSQIAADTVGGTNGQLVIFHKGHRQVRNKKLADDIWTGSRKRVLPEDFHNALKAREYDLDEIPPGVVIADVTWDQIYRTEHSDVIEAPLMRLTQEEIEEIVNDISPRSFVSVCNSRMSCFYAKVLGYRVEQQGGYFSGYHRTEDAS